MLRRLFSVSERNNGDLVVSLLPSKFYKATELDGLKIKRQKHSIHQSLESTLGINASLHGLEIKRQKYSIHRSLTSESGINAIVHRIELEGAKNLDTGNYTKAMKSKGRYAALFSARAPDLSSERYTVQAEDRDHVVLDEYSAKKATLYYMLLVCSPDHKELKDFKDARVKYIPFEYFKLVVLWSYGNYPSHSTGLKVHFATIPLGDLEGKVINEAENGMNDSDVISNFRSMRAAQSEELKSIALRDHKKIAPELVNQIFSLPFTPRPLMK
ncbi:MAG: hypothetical protein ACSHXL_05970 [Bacteroidota bacterium]